MVGGQNPTLWGVRRRAGSGLWEGKSPKRPEGGFDLTGEYVFHNLTLFPGDECLGSNLLWRTLNSRTCGASSTIRVRWSDTVVRCEYGYHDNESCGRKGPEASFLGSVGWVFV
ncbi:MAG: hypothetical protein ACYTEQ_29995 [Planctomycetota bacterium]|jgi:hypothetical protein